MRTAAVILLLAQDPSRVVVDVTLATVRVMVTAQDGRPVTSLGSSDFSLYHDGKQQQLQAVDSVGDPHRVLAVSQCAERRDDVLHPAFVRFVDGVRPQARLAVAEFDEEVKLLRDWSPLDGEVDIVPRKPNACQSKGKASGGNLILANSPNDVRELTERLNRETGRFYMLSYVPTQTGQDGRRPSRIDVRVRDSKLRVHVLKTTVAP